MYSYRTLVSRLWRSMAMGLKQNNDRVRTRCLWWMSSHWICSQSNPDRIAECFEATMRNHWRLLCSESLWSRMYWTRTECLVTDSIQLYTSWGSEASRSLWSEATEASSKLSLREEKLLFGSNLGRQDDRTSNSWVQWCWMELSRCQLSLHPQAIGVSSCRRVQSHRASCCRSVVHQRSWSTTSWLSQSEALQSCYDSQTSSLVHLCWWWF